MELQQPMQEARKAWNQAPAHIKLMAGKYMEPLLIVLESLCNRFPMEAGAKTTQITCKGTSCSSGNGCTCTGRGLPGMRE